MGVFGAVVLLHSAGSVPVREVQFARRRPVGFQAVRRDRLRAYGRALQQFPHQFQRRFGVAAFLNQHVENGSLVIDGPPEVHALAPDFHDNLIQMPAARRASVLTPEVGGELGTERVGPLADRLVSDVDAAMGEQLLNAAVAEGEAVVQPDRVADDVRRKPVALVGNGVHFRRLPAIQAVVKTLAVRLTGPQRRHVRLKLSAPAGHVSGTPQHANRIKQGKPTSVFNNKEQADALTRDTHATGTPVPGRPGVTQKTYGEPVGTGPKGGSQSTVRVHEGSDQSIHGHPCGPEDPC